MISLLYSGVCESDTYSLKPLLGILNFDLFPARDAQYNTPTRDIQHLILTQAFY